MQEVQTWIEIYDESTLETIEAVGTSSRKIIEWRQTRWRHISSGCVATGNVSRYYDSMWPSESGYVASQDMAVSSQTWWVEYIIQDGWVRIPLGWTYQCTLTRWWWSTYHEMTIYIKVWGKTVYTNTFSWGNQTETVSFIFNAWKFQLLELWWEFTVLWWPSIMLEFTLKPTMTIQQL
jgi:hypothetical protein